ncbi:hypothetical protein [Luteirhabdus pelagi]|uniref:hypothetical protein n=1 Tax=Luteirhabdus pelagi TaxID=2792783 RepID=UPI001939A155|nr:hypothetical protein [Luteirhabdus pelagi]
MKKLKIPRKLKKRLKKGIWFHQPEEDGGAYIAFPYKDAEDFKAYKENRLRNVLDKHNTRTRRQAFRKKLNAPVEVSDETLRQYVDDMLRKDIRRSSYELLIKAKNNNQAVIAYYNFVNAYQLTKKGEDSYGNICCASLDVAKRLLKK